MMLHILNRSAKSGLKKYDKQIMVISENHYGKMDGILDFLYASDCVVKIHLNQEFAEEDKKMEKTIACLVLVICFILLCWGLYAAYKGVARQGDFGFSRLLLIILIVIGILCILFDIQRS